MYLHDVSVLSVHAFSLTLRRAVFGSALEASSAIVCASEPTEILQADLHLMGNMLDSDHALAARFFRHFAGLIARQLSGAHLSRSVGVLRCSLSSISFVLLLSVVIVFEADVVYRQIYLRLRAFETHLKSPHLPPRTP